MSHVVVTRRRFVSVTLSRPYRSLGLVSLRGTDDSYRQDKRLLAFEKQIATGPLVRHHRAINRLDVKESSGGGGGGGTHTNT